jgi:chloramphenicol 3-O-phosphotransferase
MERPEPTVPVLLLNGPTGVGKTRVGLEIARALRQRQIPNAFVDVDALAYAFPVPPDDRFQQRLALRNLADVWRNHQASGARVLVLARVLETRDGLEGYRQVVPGAAVTVVRLRASLEVLTERLLRRGDPEHLERARELINLLDQTRTEDLLVETDAKLPAALAQEIIAALDWPPRLE